MIKKEGLLSKVTGIFEERRGRGSWVSRDFSRDATVVVAFFFGFLPIAKGRHCERESSSSHLNKERSSSSFLFLFIYIFFFTFLILLLLFFFFFIYAHRMVNIICAVILFLS